MPAIRRFAEDNGIDYSFKGREKLNPMPLELINTDAPATFGLPKTKKTAWQAKKEMIKLQKFRF